MNKTLLISAALISLLIVSCSKDKNDHSISNEFVAVWRVHESVVNTPVTTGFYSEFNAYTVKITDSTFGVVQKGRDPRPSWIGIPGSHDPYEYSLDTIDFKPIIATRQLYWSRQGNIGTYSANKDTLRFTYGYATDSSAEGYDTVKQTWMRY